MIQRSLLLWLILFSVVAYDWPRWAVTSFDPFAASKSYLSLLIAATMFAIGSLLPRDEIREVFEKWPTVFGGTAIQYASMPVLAFAVGNLFGFDRDVMTGVIMVGCVPGAMASNVLTLAARGNVSYSVSLTTAATMFSPVMVPLALAITLGHTRTLDPLEVGYKLLVQVVGPVVAGHLLARQFSPFARTMRTAGPVIANAAIIWIIAVVVGLNRDRLAVATLGVLGGLLTVNVLGYVAGYLGGGLFGLPESMRRALTLEVGMQNAGLGTVLTLQLFPESPTAAIPTAAYTFGCMLTGTLLAQLWSLRVPSQSVSGVGDA